MPLNGAKEFDLIVDDAGDDRGWDQADWADAKVVLQDGSELWLDDIARQATPVGGLPFSFVYGGKHSSEFINDWKREVKDEKVSDTKSRRTLTLTDPNTGLEVKAVCTIYLDTAGVDWTVYFTNKGSNDSPVIEQVRAVDATVGVGLGGQRGDPPAQRRSVRDRRLDALRPGRSRRDRRSSSPPRTAGRRTSPPGSTSTGAAAASSRPSAGPGSGAASVELSDGKLRTQAGMQNLHTILHPGESIRSPRILQLYWQGGDPYRGLQPFPPHHARAHRAADRRPARASRRLSTSARRSTS